MIKTTQYAHSIKSFRLSVFCLACCLILSVAFIQPAASTEYSNASIEPILDTAETFFVLLKKGNYSASWNLLSAKTRNRIVVDVRKAYKKMGGHLNIDEIQNDFKNGGNISNNYWQAFLSNFNPDMILIESLWEVGLIKETHAEIIIRYKKSSAPAKLKLFKENGTWKVGLTETFWSRKSLQ